MLEGVDPATDAPHLRNISIRSLKEKLVQVKGRSRVARRCLQVDLDPRCDADSLMALLDRLAEKEPSGSYSTNMIIRILKDMIDLLQPSPLPPSKDKVIGAWGELYFIETLLLRTKSPERHFGILAAWESEGESRDIIDFRFPRSRTVVEVKTTVGERLHHVNGLGQVTLPGGFKKGYLASVGAMEADGRGGRTCSDIIASLRRILAGSRAHNSNLLRALETKVDRRGRECLDDRFGFLPREGAIVLFAFDTVPRPMCAPTVLNPEWTADFRAIDPITPDEAVTAYRTLS
jgi:hypothetical protein